MRYKSHFVKEGMQTIFRAAAAALWIIISLNSPSCRLAFDGGIDYNEY